jgi:hypothetical protein
MWVAFGIPRLSDQINIDKWTMLLRGLPSDSNTARAAQSLLHRSLRIGRTDNDVGYEAIAIPTETPQLLKSLLETMGEAGYQLRKSGLTTNDTPSQTISEVAYNLDKKDLDRLMNYRITTMTDMMHFDLDGHNNWNQELCRIVPQLVPLLPQCPDGDRMLRVGQFWSSSTNYGETGIVIEVMGLNGSHFNARSW